FVRARETLSIARALRRRRADIVHLADVPAGDHAAIAAKLAGCRVVCHIRNRYDWATRFQRAWLALVDRIVFVSAHTRDNFAKNASMIAPIKRRSGTVIYDGI